MFGKRKIAALVAEFLGTAILTLLILSVQRSTLGLPFFVASAGGLAVALTMFTFANVSGGIFNPAVTLALFTVRKISALTGIVYIAVQFLGGWAAYYLYTYFVNTKLQPIGGHFTARILVAEAIGTAVFALGYAATVYRRYSAPLSAAVVGLAFMVGIVAASPASIGLLNPALALGVRSWVWGTYILGPVVGALLAVNIYHYLFADAAEVVLVEETVTTASLAAPAASTTAKSRTTKAKTAAKKPAAKPARASRSTRATTTAKRRTTRARR